MFKRLISTNATWTTVPLRLVLGAVGIAHGGQKVLGLFGGKGLSAWVAGATPFTFMRPTWLWLGAAAFSELVGGILVLLGFMTRLGGLLILFVMLTAVLGVHLPGGFFAPRGFEYPLALLAIALALIIAGGGYASIDKLLARDVRGGRGKRR